MSLFGCLFGHDWKVIASANIETDLVTKSPLSFKETIRPVPAVFQLQRCAECGDERGVKDAGNIVAECSGTYTRAWFESQGLIGDGKVGVWAGKPVGDR